MHLRTVEAFNKATNDNDSFAMYTIAKDQHARSTSFAVAQSTFRNLLNITKTGSFAQLIHDLEDEKRKFSAIFDRDSTGTVEINDIWVMVLVNSLPDDEFSFMKETLYSKDLSANFPQYSVVLQDMQNYDLNKKKATPKQEPPVPAGPTALSAASALPAKSKCGICSKMFPRTLRRDSGDPYLNCFACNQKAKEARLATAANPTPAQVAGAQASLKRAQAVLLAAKVNEKVTTADPIIPPPTLQETDKINSFMQSQHFSLSATTKTTVPNLVEDSDDFWVVDSGATYSTTFRYRDLHHPSKLLTPIPITSADGTIIYATHVGSSCLGTLIHYAMAT